MEQYVIKGGNPLVGEVEIGGAKNAALGILVMRAVMTDETVAIENVPGCHGIPTSYSNAIEEIGARVERLDRSHGKDQWIFYPGG